MHGIGTVRLMPGKGSLLHNLVLLSDRGAGEEGLLMIVRLRKGNAEGIEASEIGKVNPGGQ